MDYTLNYLIILIFLTYSYSMCLFSILKDCRAGESETYVRNFTFVHICSELLDNAFV